MFDPSAFTDERVAAVDVDPGLLLHAFEMAAEAPKRRGQGPDIAVICAEAYTDYHEIDAAPGEDALAEEDLLTMIALAYRMSALLDVMEQGGLANPRMTDDERMAIMEAACGATLLQVGERPQFQLLDFLAHLSRAREAAGW
jgi:hypothetical protein